MKKIGMILIALLICTVYTNAQPGRGSGSFNPEQMAKQQTARLKEILDLDQKQEKEVFEITLETGEKMKEMRGNRQGNGRPEGMREKIVQIREDANEKMKEILTEEQWTQYVKYMEERRQRFNRNGSGRRR